MRKIFSILALSVAISFFGISAAQAITVDGVLSPASEWDTWIMSGTDPDEGTITDDYDIRLFRTWWDGTTAYIRTDVWGTPNFTQLDLTEEDMARYQWNLDTDNDLLADVYVRLKGEDVTYVGSLGTGILRIYNTSWTQLGTGTAKIDDILEGSFAVSILNDNGYGAPYNIFMKIENQGDDPDDRLPNTGWVTRVPEPSSMFLLGLGLFGFVGGRVRRRFKA